MTGLLLLAGILSCMGILLALRGGLTSPNGTTVLGMDMQGIGISVLAIAAAMFFFGPVFGIALVLVVAIHEFGHVAAFRVAGHHDARFRLIPLLGGYAISNRPVDTQEEDVFITLMGPAIGIGPMLLAYGLYPFVAPVSPEAGNALLTFAGISGALNFFNLLPIWPLDGGRLTSYIAGVFWEPLPLLIGTVTTGLLMMFAIYAQSIFIGIIAVIGLQNLLSTGGSDGRAPYRRMSKGRAVLCLAAWLTTAATLFLGGLSIILRFV